MADNVEKIKANEIEEKSSILAFGMSGTLEKENNELKKIVQQTIIDTKTKLGERTNTKPINYFNEINFGKAFNDLFANTKDSNLKDTDANKEKAYTEFKKYMENNSSIDIGNLLAEDKLRSMIFNNYRIIHKHIPECSQALNVYKDNIISPDDFTKLIFNVTYKKAVGSDDEKEKIEDRLDDLNEKYQLEDKADQIIEEALLLGESYYAVLPLDSELTTLLNDRSGMNLNESLRIADVNSVDIPVLSENIEMNNESLEALNEFYGLTENNKMTENSAKENIAKAINEMVTIGSSKEFLIERFEADRDFNKNKSDIDDKFYSIKTKGHKKKVDNKPLGVNGSALRKLVPERVIELKIDDICYGYYYAEENINTLAAQSSYIGTASGRNINGTMSIAQNNTVSATNSASYTPNNSASAQLGIGEQKLRLISDIFLGAISKKIDKDFIRKNKQFKDFIYDLLRQDFIVKKGLKLTYFRPEEVIKFEAQPVYRDIVFFAKLYLAILTNNLLIKLGRAHDKRTFYVNVGVDAAYEQAIQTVIQDIKTKDYKMENLNDFNTVLNLTPGRFDDYFIPMINGEKPIDIETLPGMDVEMNNEFVDFLKNSMMSGMSVPRNLIDVSTEVDFARSISALNANFIRSVVRYQKHFTPSFTRLYQKLYENEYKYNDDGVVANDLVDISAIKVEFPSPATLAMTNMSEQISTADQNADFIATQLVYPDPNGTNEELRLLLKSHIIKSYLPGIPWSDYEDFLEEARLEKTKEKVSNPAPPVDDQGMY